jgi:biopolymer transport protein ExbD
MTTAKQRLLDIWLVESNTVYRGVPFVVVTDWLQQGRLLAEDCVRLAGSKKWHDIRAVPALAPYLPKAEPHQAQDTAEALEPVELGLEAGRLIEEEDEDVDMIPLIDISLVLLIFFMMTTTVVIASSSIAVPEAGSGATLANPGMLWIGIDKVGDSPEYSFGEGEKPASDDNRGLNVSQVLQKLDARLKGIEDPVEIRISAHKDLPYEIVKKLTVELEPYRRKHKIRDIRAEVNERKP